MAGEGLILETCILTLTEDMANPIYLEVTNTATEDDPNVDDRLYADGRTRSVVGYLDPAPFNITITRITPEDLERLLDASSKTAIYRPDSNLGVWDVVVGKVRFNQDPKALGEDFKVVLSLHRQTTR